jgi:hypothetical protein
MKSLNQLKTFEGACKVEGLDPKTVIPNFSNFLKKDQASMIAHAKLVIIVRAANRLANGGEEWIPDFDNPNQYKYEAWLYKEKRGSSGFRFHGFGYWDSGSYVGSRLCFISRDVAEYVVTNFNKLYNEYFL